MNYIYGMMMISPLLKYFDGPDDTAPEKAL